MGDDERKQKIDDAVAGPAPGSETTAPLDTLPEGLPWKGRRYGPGRRIGRFVVLELIGEGGMGQVYACYDPALDRRVALKMLRLECLAGDELRIRMLREARAMAKVSHPNVVTVHEVGELDDDAYLAMELVDGADLGRWLSDERRDRQAILDVFRMAGRGLAAAHAVGLVHRDFKPRNVLIGDDGRARVTDFGLVQPAGEESLGPGDERIIGGLRDRSSSETLTRQGTAVGTPRYMAPEQLEGGRVDARADQFAFCVALYEALTGAHPYGDGSIAEVRDRSLAGERVHAGAEKQLPPRLLAALERGLSLAPKDRFADMDELLLAFAPPGRRRRAVIAIAVVGVLVAAAVAFPRAGGRDEPCGAVAHQLAAVWGPAAQQQARRAFLATDRPHAAAVFDRFSAQIDRYAGEWIGMRTALCHERQDGTLPSEIDVVRTLCLDRGRARLTALLEAFAGRVDAIALDRAVDAVRTLPAVSACADVDALLIDEPLPAAADARERVERARASLDRAEAMYWAARYAHGARLLDEAAGELQPADHASTQARLHLIRARIASELADNDAAERELQAAITEGARARDTKLEAKAWRELVFQVGVRSRRPADALALVRSAELAILRASEPELVASDLQATLGAVHLAREDHATAEHHYLRALEILERAGVDDGIRLGHILNNLGNVHYLRKELAEARDHYERAAESFELALGAIHPLVADALLNTGATYQESEQYDQARARYERALEIWEQVLEPDHPKKGVPLLNLGMIAQAQEDFVASAAYFDGARGIFEARFGREHEYVALALTGLGEARLGADDVDGARGVLTEALRIGELGLSPGRLAETQLAMAKVLWRAGQRDAALDLARRAREGFRAGGALWTTKLDETTAWLSERGR